MAITGYFHVTPAGAGTKSGADWTNAFGEPEFKAHIEGSGTAGYVYFIASGEYTLDSSINSGARAGTSVSPISLIGVKGGTTNVGADIVYSDWARSPYDRPLFDTGALQIAVGSNYVIRNLRFTGASSFMLLLGYLDVVENCFFEGYASSAGLYIVGTNTNCIIINCGFTTPNTYGLYINNGLCSFCYFYNINDSTYGRAITPTSESTISNNIFNNCNEGIHLSADIGVYIINNTFYLCGTAVSATTGFANAYINNILEGCRTNGFLSTTQEDLNFYSNNHGDDARNTDMWNGVDDSGIFQDNGVSTGDPLFTASGTFTLETGSPCIDTGLNPYGY